MKSVYAFFGLVMEVKRDKSFSFVNVLDKDKYVKILPVQPLDVKQRKKHLTLKEKEMMVKHKHVSSVSDVPGNIKMTHLTDGNYVLKSKIILQPDESLFYVKLTASADRAINEYIKNPNKFKNQPCILFTKNNEGQISIPISRIGGGGNGKEQFHFKFTITVDQDVAKSRNLFECYHYKRNNVLESIGSLERKLCILANDDIYETTKNRMAAIEEQQKSRRTREIDWLFQTTGKKPKMLSPSNNNKETVAVKSSTSGHQQQQQNVTNKSDGVVVVNKQPTDSKKKPDILLMRKPLKERMIHLLAVRPYSKNDLFVAINRLSIQHNDVNRLTSTLSSVAALCDSNGYDLLKEKWKDVQEDWPFYTADERERVKKRKQAALSSTSSQPSSTDDVTRHDVDDCPISKKVINRKPSPIDSILASESDKQFSRSTHRIDSERNKIDNSKKSNMTVDKPNSNNNNSTIDKRPFAPKKRISPSDKSVVAQDTSATSAADTSPKVEDSSNDDDNRKDVKSAALAKRRRISHFVTRETTGRSPLEEQDAATSTAIVANKSSINSWFKDHQNRDEARMNNPPSVARILPTSIKSTEKSGHESSVGRTITASNTSTINENNNDYNNDDGNRPVLEQSSDRNINTNDNRRNTKSPGNLSPSLRNRHVNGFNIPSATPQTVLHNNNNNEHDEQHQDMVLQNGSRKPFYVQPAKDVRVCTPDSTQDALLNRNGRIHHNNEVSVYDHVSSDSYAAITTMEQRRVYKKDFYHDYREYQMLHKKMNMFKSNIVRFGEMAKQYPIGSPEYKRLEAKVIEKYESLKTDQHFNDTQNRYNNLHEKLALIKGRIQEYDDKIRKQAEEGEGND